jgi:hypothetical protein
MTSHLGHPLKFWGYDSQFKVASTRSGTRMTCMKMAFILNM